MRRAVMQPVPPKTGNQHKFEIRISCFIIFSTGMENLSAFFTIAEVYRRCRNIV